MRLSVFHPVLVKNNIIPQLFDSRPTNIFKKKSTITQKGLLISTSKTVNCLSFSFPIIQIYLNDTSDKATDVILLHM